MCAPLAIPLVALAAGAGATYHGQSIANDAGEAAIARTQSQQAQLQQRQQQMLQQQDQQREEARAIFQNNVLPTITKDNVQGKEDAQAARLNSIFSGAAQATAGAADPTREATAVSTEGAPTQGTATAGARAYDTELAKNLSRAIGFNMQQAGARANTEGRGYAAQEQQRALSRTAEGIGAKNETINGIGRNVVGLGNLMDATTAAGQAEASSAMHAGDSWKTVGTLSNLVASVFGPLGKLALAYNAAKPGKNPVLTGSGAGLGAQRYYSPTGQRIN